MNRQI